MKLDISGIRRKLKNTSIHLTYRRKCRLYGVGLAKTGTMSLAGMFNRTVVTRHESMQSEMSQAVLDLHKGRIDRADLRALVLKRDKEYCADVNSAGINASIVDILLEEFPDALFLLTMRDPYSWMDSAFNMRMKRTLQERKGRSLYRELRECDLDTHQLKHPPEEQSLEAEGLSTLDSVLAYWNKRNQTVLSTVPEHRLLIVKTMDITKRAYEIADFAGLPRSSIQLSLSRSYQNRASRKYHLLEGIDRKHLDMKVQEHCGSLMKQYFPEISSMDDVRF